MKDSKVMILGVLFFLFCAALAGGVWYLNGAVEELQGEYDDLEQRRVDLETTTNALQQQVRVFKQAFSDLEQYHIQTAASDMGFIADVQQEVQSNGVNILSTRQGAISKDGRSSLSLVLRGDYYSFTRVLAQWRNLSTTVRVASLNVTGSKTPETQGEVQADVVVEAIVSSKK